MDFMRLACLGVTLKTDLDKAVLWSRGPRMTRATHLANLVFPRNLPAKPPVYHQSWIIRVNVRCFTNHFGLRICACWCVANELGLHSGVNSMLNDVASLESGYDPTSAPPTDKEIESEVAHLVRGLCQAVATRHFVEAHTELVRDVEALQRRVWLQAERRYDQRT